MRNGRRVRRCFILLGGIISLSRGRGNNVRLILFFLAFAHGLFAAAVSYEEWVAEDVLYIIADEEEAVWRGLATEGEREKFIKQFWLRRDPTPNTYENEYKAEHYRRIAFANEKYAFGGAGWKTDRGRIYIRFGPPDRIELRSTDGPGENWHYRWIEEFSTELDVEFVDAAGTGEYRIVAPNRKSGGRIAPVPGLTLMQQMGLVPLPAGFIRTEEIRVEPKRPTLRAKAKAKDSATVFEAASRVNKRPLPLTADFLQITAFSMQANLTIHFENKDLWFRRGQSKVNIYARITTRPGSVVDGFEGVVMPTGPREITAYRKALPLPAGDYSLAVIVEDHSSGRMRVYEIALAVPAPHL